MSDPVGCSSSPHIAEPAITARAQVRSSRGALALSVAPLRKRFAFVASNDGHHHRALLPFSQPNSGYLSWASNGSKPDKSEFDGRRKERRTAARPCVTCCVTARRANHQKSVQPFAQKYSAFVLTQISRTTPFVSRRMRGVGHRHERAVRCGGRESCD